MLKKNMGQHRDNINHTVNVISNVYSWIDVGCVYF